MSLSLQRLHLGVAQPTPGELLSGLHVRLVTFRLWDDRLELLGSVLGMTTSSETPVDGHAAERVYPAVLTLDGLAPETAARNRHRCCEDLIDGC